MTGINPRGGSRTIPAYRLRGVLAASLAVVLLGHGAAARAGLTIVPTFDSSIASDPNAVAIEGAINAAISAVENAVTTPITVSIDFQNMNSGLGQSETTTYIDSYYDYYNSLKAQATSAAQLAALASLGPAPTSESSGNPVNGNSQITFSSANGRALGLNTPGVLDSNGNFGGSFDSIIGLNTSLTSPPHGLSGFYGLQSVAAHEIDEALGIGGEGSNLDANSPTTGPIAGLDLYRYSAPGVRNYSTSDPTNTPYSYFSIDGGNTVLSYFNQDPRGDYGDWYSVTGPAPGFGAQVQDAFGFPGTDPTLGPNELTALNVVGYTLAVPEPSSVSLLGCGMLAVSAIAWRGRNRNAGRTAA